MKFSLSQIVRYSLIGLGALVLIVIIALTIITSVYSSSVVIPEKDAADIRVATYNVHYIIAEKETGAWSVGDWEARKEPLRTAVSALDADIIAFQEMETFNGTDRFTDTNLTLTWLLETNPHYTAGAVGDTADFPSTQPILYRFERFTLLDQGWFFFSTTPDVLYSRTFNGSYPAFASWIELSDTTTGNTFKVLNLHTDYKSYSNRQQSLELVRARVQPWLDNNESVLVLGDFNAFRGSAIHRTLEDIGLVFAPVSASTYHFNRGFNLFPAIDHIAYSSQFTLSKTPVVVQQKFGDTWPTDHYPVVADFSLHTQ